MGSNSVNGDVNHEHYVKYYTNGATSTETLAEDENGKYVSVGYDGIISTEYNPERWNEASSNQSTPKNFNSANWTAPDCTATAILALPIVTSGTEYKVTLPDKYTIEGWTQDPSTKVWSHTATAGESGKTLDIKLHFSDKSVFGGWTTLDGTNDYLPGDVIPNTIGSLKAKWIEPDHFIKETTLSWSSNAIDLSGLVVLSELTLCVGSDKIINIQSETYTNTSKIDGVAKIVLKEKVGNDYVDVTYNITFGKDSESGPVRQDRSMYGTIYYLPASNGYDNKLYNVVNPNSSTGIPSGTYHSDANNKARVYAGTQDASNNGKLRLKGDVLFDTIDFGTGANRGNAGSS